MDIEMLDDKVKVDWFGVFDAWTGYGTHGRSIVKNLSDDIDINCIHIGESHDVKSELTWLKDLLGNKRNNPFEDINNVIEVWNLNPQTIHSVGIQSLYNPNIYKVAYTVYEAETIPKSWICVLNMFDEIWVPAPFVKESFRRSGVEPDIYVMPEGVDQDFYSEDGEKLYNCKEFTFLSVFDFTYRKGWDKLLHAYYQEFDEEDDVTLLIHTRYSSCNEKHRKYVINKINNIASQYDDDLTTRISFGFLNRKDMPKLYRSGDCFVLSTRGDGFGLPIFESASCGTPVITTNYGAPPNFLDDGVYWIDIEGTKPYPWEEAYKHQPNCTGLEFGEPSLESLREQMRKVYESDEPKVPDVSEYDWVSASKKVEDRLKHIWSIIE